MSRNQQVSRDRIVIPDQQRMQGRPVPGASPQHGGGGGFIIAVAAVALILAAVLGTRAAASSSGGATSSGSSVKIGKSMAASAYGWTGSQWHCLNWLWTRESGWRSDAQNPHSTAYGIAQFLDSTWANYGPKTSDPALQIRYGLKYIRQRYGSPCGAWGHETSAGWY